MGIFLIVIAFVVIMLVAYLSYRKSEAEEHGTQYEGNGTVMTDVGKKALYYAIMAVVFIVATVGIVSLESLIFEEPKRGYVYGAFALAVMVAGFVGKLCKKWLKI